MLAAGCSGGPRFADTADRGFDHWDTEAFDLSEGWLEMSEEKSRGKDYPGEVPKDGTLDDVSLPEEMFQGVIWRGNVGWGALSEGAPEDLGSCGDVGLFSYSGDTELLAFDHSGGGPLCLAAITKPPISRAAGVSPLWESVLFRRGGAGCPAGPWLNQEGPDLDGGAPVPLGMGSVGEEGSFYLYFGSDALGGLARSRGSYLLFLTGIQGSQGAFEGSKPGCRDRDGDTNSGLPCVDYRVAVGSVPSEDACRRLYLALEDDGFGGSQP